MTKRHDEILADLEGVKGQAFLFTVMLRDFAETLERRIPADQIPRLLEDIENNPYWLEKWGESADMQHQYMIVMIAAKTLAEEYVAEHVKSANRKQLEEST